MKKVSAFVIILILIIVFALITLEKKNNSNPTSISSIKGCYVNQTGKDVYTLSVDQVNSGNVTGILAFNNYQKDSSSGSFNGTYVDNILRGTYSFDSEGMHSERELVFQKSNNDFIEGFGNIKVENGKEIFIDINSVNYDPKFTFKKDSDCLLNFSDANNTFTFQYNPIFHTFSSGENLPTLEWRTNAEEEGIILANLIIPRTFMPKTNFSDARFTAGRSSDSKAIQNCITPSPNGETKNGSRTISGYPFSKFLLNDAAAGNYYETTSYRGIIDGDCYALEYTIHSTNIENYPRDQGIESFDKSKIKDELEKVLDSFKFLINSD